MPEDVCEGLFETHSLFVGPSTKAWSWKGLIEARNSSYAQAVWYIFAEKVSPIRK